MSFDWVGEGKRLLSFANCINIVLSFKLKSILVQKKNIILPDINFLIARLVNAHIDVIIIRW